MAKSIVIAERDNIAAVFEDNQITEFYIHRGDILLGDVYLSKVENILPSIEAAFVNVGSDKMGFLHAADVIGKGGLQGSLTQLITDLDGRTLPAWRRVQHYIAGFHGLVHSAADGGHFILQPHGLVDDAGSQSTAGLALCLMLGQRLEKIANNIRCSDLLLCLYGLSGLRDYRRWDRSGRCSGHTG